MIRARRFRLAILFSLALTFATGLVAEDRKFTTSTTLATEARTLVKILEEWHYNRDAVHSADFAQTIPDYMDALDVQHMFFLARDKATYTDKFGKSVYYNTAFLGNIEAAYEIFGTYEQRAEARFNWIFAELKKDFDFSTSDTYRLDRTKAEWPDSPAAADELWRRRLKFELLDEVLNKKTIEQAKEVVRKRYERARKRNTEIEGDDLAELYLSTIARLYDPHSTYFSADTFEDFGIQMKLRLVGIGALLGVEDDICVVKEIVPGGPADVGRKLKPNDKIISVAQTGQEPVEIIGMKLRKIVEIIRGEKGTDVHLIVQPAEAADVSARKEVVITRDLVKLEAQRAHAAVFQVPGPDGKEQALGVITLPAFYNSDEPDAEKASASKDVARLIEQLTQAKVQGIVLDLRRNGGGYLSEAIDLAGLFIKQGPVVQVKNYNGEIQVDNDTNNQVAYAGPLAVLVDRFSASASEIVSGALQNYGRAIVIGDSSTHGKGSVQQVAEMKQLSPALARAIDPQTHLPAKIGAAKFTVQKYYLPSGDSTQKKGVVPDIVLPSITDYIPNIGEGDLPHALVWDKIPTSFFDGTPLDAKVLTPLRQASLERQSKLDEFAYLKKNVDWFKTRQEKKLVSLNLEERKSQKVADDAFRKSMKAERERLAKNDYVFKEYRLGPPPPPRIKAKKSDKSDASSDDDDEDEDELSTDDNESYPKADVHLRESLRVVSDAIALGQNRELWAANNRPPLTVDDKG
jgi:carboxyl-terminal processing protease